MSSNNYNPMLLIDFYKATHNDQFPQGMTKSVSYLTPRMSRINNWDKAICFGVQSFCKTWLIDYFNDNFFNKDVDEVVNEYDRVLSATLGANSYNSKKIRDLHNLGYLPIEVRAIKEGERVDIKVPMVEFSNTHKDFAWLPQALESLFSSEIYHPILSANVGYSYRQVVNRFYNISVEDNVPRNTALGDFSFRGQECLQSAIKSSSAWLLSFVNTSNVPSILYLENMYNCDCTKEIVGKGSVSTEHSCECTNFAVDGDEITHLKRLLTKTYKNISFSKVSDSYDYWNMVDNILPQCKKEILEHNGCFLCRGDSGNPIEIVTQTVFHLWDIFGGTINSKGYKVLNPKVKAIYGDSITIQRCEEIYEILVKNGFACNNVALGVGSFSMQCIEENSVLKPFTRDTLGFAIKCTYAEVDNKPIFVYKNPKTDSGNFKKSQKGCCIVYKEENGNFSYVDEKTFEESKNDSNNELKIVFKNGQMTKEFTLKEIRQTLYNGEF